MALASIRDRLDDYVFEAGMTQRKLTGDAFTQERVASMVPLLVEQMRGMDLTEEPVYGGQPLLPLGKARSTSVGHLTCERFVYLGMNGKFYIYGPRRKRMIGVVIDIHPYGVDDAQGWGGISLSSIADLLTTYFI